MPGHTLQTNKRHTFEVLALVPLVWGKTVSCRLCAGQSKGTLKNVKKMLFLDLVPPTLKNSGIFQERPVLISTLTVCRRNRGDPSSLYRTYGALQVYQSIIILVWPGAAHAPMV